MKYEDYDKQKMLFERFIQNSNLKDLDKMKKLSENNNYHYSKSEKKKFNVRKLFHSYKYNNPAYGIYKRINKNNDNYKNDYNDNDIGTGKNNLPSEINDYKLDFRNIIIDPEYKDKCLKGNYKWGNMKFNMLKMNMAKRRGVSIENFKMPKYDNNKNKMKRMEMNGRLVIDNIIDNNNIANHRTEANKESNTRMITDIFNNNNDFINRNFKEKINNENYNNYYSNNIYDNKYIF